MIRYLISLNYHQLHHNREINMIEIRVTNWLPEEDIPWLESEQKRFELEGVKTKIESKEDALIKNRQKYIGYALFKLTKLNGSNS